MRKIEYLSPSSIASYLKNRDEFYLTYLADARAPRFAQTQPMSIGSSFDAYVKSFLHEALFGKNNDPKFNLKTLFEAQVEPHNRDWAWEHGAYAFECYKRSGALGDLMLELQSSIGTPRFEIDVKGAINGYREGITKRTPDGVTFLGKPDVFYINKHGTNVNLDFKVNGWCSKNNVSPMKGYIKIRSGDGVPTLTGPHKDCIPMAWNGAVINCGHFLEDLDEDWARQLTIYGWLCGVDIGADFIIAVDQMVCKPSSSKYPSVRIAEHRLRVRPEYQWRLFAQAQEIWDIIRSNHYFRELPLAESQAKCEMLEKQANQLRNPATAEDAIFNQMTRSH